MPLGAGFYGTNADGSDAMDFCKFCFQQGSYTDPTLTMDRMILLSIENMVGELGMDEKEAQQLAHSVIPTLKRWLHDVEA